MLHVLNPLNHVRAVRRWADVHGVQMHLSVSSWSLTLTRGQQVQRLVPRFVVQRDGRLCYVRTFDDTAGFAGWHHPHQESWALASDKVVFKRHASAIGLRVPAGWNTGEPLADDFVRKKRKGSFGADIDGPFNARVCEAKPVPDETYHEQFISGRSAKAWCWNGKVVVLELIEPPHITGDGRRNLQELAAPRGNVNRALPLEKAKDMLAWQGFTAGSIPAAGQKVLLGFKYVTPFDAPVHGNRNVWQEQEEHVRHQFARAASLLQASMPAQPGGRVLFTLDAVVDAQGRAWFLEMNSHPMIHPDVYAPMLTTLMGIS